eukprot:scaffold247996_cov30-Tisochrysis_lutea.AAC.2
MIIGEKTERVYERRATKLLDAPGCAKRSGGAGQRANFSQVGHSCSRVSRGAYRTHSGGNPGEVGLYRSKILSPVRNTFRKFRLDLLWRLNQSVGRAHFDEATVVHEGDVMRLKDKTRNGGAIHEVGAPAMLTMIEMGARSTDIKRMHIPVRACSRCNMVSTEACRSISRPQSISSAIRMVGREASTDRMKIR